jgi:hypothetical protein
MDDRLESGFGGRADEKIQTAREVPPLLGRKKSYPQHLTIAIRGSINDCHSCESRNPVSLMILDSASKPALSAAEWVRNDTHQTTGTKALA